MPPKVKIDRENIIKTAVDIVRNNGEEALNARNIAAVLGCSTQPIFSNFKSMDELKTEVIKVAYEIYWHLIDDKCASDYKAQSIAYITFAKKEKNLFKLLFLFNDDISLKNKLEQLIFEKFGLSKDAATLFHFEMWAFVHGMAIMTATAKFPLHDGVINQIFDDAYEGLKTRFNL